MSRLLTGAGVLEGLGVLRGIADGFGDVASGVGAETVGVVGTGMLLGEQAVPRTTIKISKQALRQPHG